MTRKDDLPAKPAFELPSLYVKTPFDRLDLFNKMKTNVLIE